jgi:hypothetical protein
MSLVNLLYRSSIPLVVALLLSGCYSYLSPDASEGVQCQNGPVLRIGIPGECDQTTGNHPSKYPAGGETRDIPGNRGAGETGAGKGTGAIRLRVQRQPDKDRREQCESLRCPGQGGGHQERITRCWWRLWCYRMASLVASTITCLIRRVNSQTVHSPTTTGMSSRQFNRKQPKTATRLRSACCAGPGGNEHTSRHSAAKINEDSPQISMDIHFEKYLNLCYIR